MVVWGFCVWECMCLCACVCFLSFSVVSLFLSCFYVILLCFRCPFIFSWEREREGVNLGGRRCRSLLGGSGRGKTLIRIYCMKKNVFNKTKTGGKEFPLGILHYGKLCDWNKLSAEDWRILELIWLHEWDLLRSVCFRISWKEHSYEFSGSEIALNLVTSWMFKFYCCPMLFSHSQDSLFGFLAPTLALAGSLPGYSISPQFLPQLAFILEGPM